MNDESSNYSPNEMSGEEKFWYKLWQSVIVGLVLVIMSLSPCNMYEKNRIADALKAGVDPVEARMALSGQDTTSVQIVTSILSKQMK